MKIKLVSAATVLALVGVVALPLSVMAHGDEASSNQQNRYSGMGNGGQMMSGMMGNGMMGNMMSGSEDISDMMSNMQAFMSSHMGQMLDMMDGDDDGDQPSHSAQPDNQ